MPRRWTCERLGITMPTFIEHRRTGRFGDLPPRQGGHYPRPRSHEVDDAEKGTVLGVKREDWQARRDAVAAKWSEAERNHRKFWCPTPGRDDIKSAADDMPQWGTEWTVQEISSLHFHDTQDYE